MTFEQLKLKFLKDHRDADEIVIDTKTFLPVKAVYKYSSIGGLRAEETIYWFRSELADAE